jgi:hypothetical protein
MSDGPTFRDELVAAGVLVPTASDGIYGRSSVYEDIVAGLEGLVNATAASEGSASYRFPPVMPRSVLEQSGYLSSFPDMIGSVSIFRGDNADHKRLIEVAQSGGEWTSFLEAADVSLCPAVCHPLYPTLRGTLPEGGRRYDVSGWCFRREPSLDPARMQSFRQHDLVYVGDAEQPGNIATAGCSSVRRSSTRSAWRLRRWWRTTPSSGGSAASWPRTRGRRRSSTRL